MVRSSEWITKGWELVTKRGQFWMFVVLTLIYFVVGGAIGQITRIGLPAPPIEAKPSFAVFAGFFLSMMGHQLLWAVFVTGPITFLLMASAYSVILHFLKTGQFDLGRTQDAFRSEVIINLLLAGFLVGLFATVGVVFCIFPGLLIQSLYLFPLLLILDKKLTFWEAMEESRKKVQASFWGFVGFFLLTICVALLGVLACGLGLLVAQPVVWSAIVIAYRELWPENIEGANLSTMA